MRKTLFAVVTFKWFFFRVYPSMHLQQAGVYEHLATELTSKRTSTIMVPHMPLEFGCRDILFITYTTFKTLLSCMFGHDMQLQARALLERFLAGMTNKGALPIMGLHMFFQVLDFDKRNVTNITVKCPLFLMMIFYMVFQFSEMNGRKIT